MRVNNRSAWNHPIWMLIVVCFLSGTLYPQNDPCQLRRTLIGVSGKNGERSEGLTVADFNVTVGGKAASLQSAMLAELPPRVVILVDASANHDQSTWAATRAMVEEFLAGFPEVADFTLLAFDDKLQQVVQQTDRASLQGTMAEMFPSGKRESEAGLAKAVKKASSIFDVYRQGDAEFLVTTSDQIRKETEQALRQQRAVGIRLFGLSFDQSRHPSALPFDLYMKVEDYSPLGAAAKASGGLWMWFDMSGQGGTASLQNARAAGKGAATLVRNYFTLDLRLTKPLAKPEKLKIELLKSPRVDAKDIYTAYPQELFPCQSSK